MNEICKTCDTRIRLQKCNGRDGDFRYCFRKVGSTYGLEKTIVPFSDLHELYQKSEHLQNSVVEESMFLDGEDYGRDGHMVLLMGRYILDPDGNRYPIGFVTK